jgi:hypothetical protein
VQLHHYGSLFPIEVHKMPALPLSSASPETVAILARNAGLSLSPAHMAELVDAYGYIERMLARLHRNRARADEPAHIFVPTVFEPKGEVAP